MTTAPDPDSKALVERCLAGDARSWNLFVRTYTPLLARVARRTLGRFGMPSDAPVLDDRVQEVFARLLRDDRKALAGIDWSRPIERFLSAVMAHHCVDWIRSERGTSVLEPRRRWERLWEDLPASSQGNDRLVSETDEVRHNVRNALDRLPPRERLALQLYYWDAVTTDRIAMFLGLSEGSARPLLARARGHLKEILKGTILVWVASCLPH